MLRSLSIRLSFFLFLDFFLPFLLKIFHLRNFLKEKRILNFKFLFQELKNYYPIVNFLRNPYCSVGSHNSILFPSIS
ncbi:hypothetical protein D1631_09835 [Chryseobacterium nematophagum]|uniref:Uncharacterized protein n=1 Tax=Chryseobacterium nematophagum TaxID=2305228 RepID=A0A3M7TJ22_9FLAO|nr:hypothetical protein D1631_09835 [Chryseobacterium nematophagum]